MSRVVKVVASAVMLSLLLLCVTGCTEDIADGVSSNSKVIGNMRQYVKDRYGTEVDIDHVIRQGGASTGRVYIADVNIANKDYILTGKYADDGSYSNTSDTIIDTIVNERELSRVGSLLSSTFNEYKFDVSAKTNVNSEHNFGKIPSYDELVSGGHFDENSSESIVGVIYCDLSNIKSDLRGKMNNLRQMINPDIRTNVALYLVDESDKETVDNFITNNDFVSVLSVFNSSNKLDTKIDCCNSVIRFSSYDYDNMEHGEAYNYIQEIKKSDKSEDDIGKSSK